MKELLTSIIIFIIILIDVLLYLRLIKKVDKNHNIVEANFNEFVEKTNHNNRVIKRFIEAVGKDFEKVNKRIDELQPKEEVEEQPKRTVGRPKKVKGE